MYLGSFQQQSPATVTVPESLQSADTVEVVHVEHELRSFMWNMHNNKGLRMFSRLCQCSIGAGEHNTLFCQYCENILGGF